MHINGPSPSIPAGAMIRPAAPAARGTDTPRSSGVVSERSAVDIATPAKGSPRTIPVEAPPGTDPELWSILTAEERAYFANTATRGPLTYLKVMSPQRTPTPPVARGGRLDVRG